MKGFLEFIRKQGVVGLAVGFILGGAVSDLVKALVTDIVNPIVSPLLTVAGDLKTATLVLGPVKLLWGDCILVLINFTVIAAVVYYGVHGLGLDKLDKPKE